MDFSKENFAGIFAVIISGCGGSDTENCRFYGSEVEVEQSYFYSEENSFPVLRRMQPHYLSYPHFRIKWDNDVNALDITSLNENSDILSYIAYQTSNKFIEEDPLNIFNYSHYYISTSHPQYNTENIFDSSGRALSTVYGITDMTYTEVIIQWANWDANDRPIEGKLAYRYYDYQQAEEVEFQCQNNLLSLSYNDQNRTVVWKSEGDIESSKPVCRNWIEKYRYNQSMLIDTYELWQDKQTMDTPANIKEVLSIKINELDIVCSTDD